MLHIEEWSQLVLHSLNEEKKSIGIQYQYLEFRYINLNEKAALFLLLMLLLSIVKLNDFASAYRFLWGTVVHSAV